MSKLLIAVPLAACMTLTACSSGGGGNGNGGNPPPPAAKQYVLYVSDEATLTVDELFLADIDNPGTSMPLSAPITAANLELFAAFFNDTWVTYTTDLTTLGLREAYATRFDDPGVATRINADLVAGATGVEASQALGDGTRFVYVADQDTADVNELYLTDLANPGLSTKLNPPLVAGGNVESFVIGIGLLSADGTQFFYLADQDTDEMFELYRVTLANPGVSTKINAPLQADGSVTGARLTPDGRLIYRADQDTDDAFELYMVNLATPGVATKLSGPLVASGTVSFSFRLAPDGTRVVYLADAETNNQDELFTVALGTPGNAVKLNPDFTDANMDVENFTVAQDSATFYYIADQDTDQERELYRVSIATPGTTTKVSGPLAAGGSLGFQPPLLNLQETHILYVADPAAANVEHVYVVDLATPGTAVQASDNVVAGSEGVGQAFWTSSGDTIQYDADQATVDQVEIWTVTLDSLGPGNSVRINPAFGPNVSSNGGHVPIPIEFLFPQLGL